MIEVLPFLIRKKWQASSRWPNIVKLVLFTIVALFGGIINGFGIAVILDLLTSEQPLSVDQVLFGYTLMIGVLFLLLDMFPVPKQVGGEITPYYPITTMHRIRINLTFSFLRHFMFYAILMHTILTLVSDSVTILQSAVSFLIIMSFYLLNRIMISSISFKVKNGFVLVSAGLIFVILNMFNYWLNQATLVSIITCVITLFLLFGLLYLIEVRKKSKRISNTEKSKKSLFMKLISKRETKGLLLLGYGFKLLLLIGIGTILVAKGKTDLQGMFWVPYLLGSPLLLFTYMGMNFFGINRTLFLTHTLREIDIKGLKKVYFKFITPIGLVDLLIFVLFLKITNLYSAEFVLFHITMFWALFFMGFYISINAPVVRKNFLSIDFQQNSTTVSFYGIAIAFLILGASFAATLWEYFYIADMMIILISSWFFFGVNYNLNKSSQKMFTKIRAL